VGANSPGAPNGRQKTTLLLGLGGIVLLVDLATKSAVSRTLHLGQSIDILGTFIRITYIHNRGAIFGISLGEYTGTVVLVVSLLAAVVLTVYYYRLRYDLTWYRIGLVLIISGAFGNLFDRIALGEVRDFLDVGIGGMRWPIFNVADLAVTIGAMILAFELFRDGKTGQPSEVSAE
jgi:signal peptidase II